MRILIAEDDRSLARFLKKGMEAEHHAVDIAHDGEEACSMVRESDYDLLVLDLILPRMDGLQVLQSVQAKKAVLPILVLSGRHKMEDRVKALDLGADDYLVKPFSFAEFSARVRALLRRGRRPPVSVLCVEDLEMDRVGRTVSRAGARIELTPKEFALLEYMMLHAGRRVTRAMIVDHVWNLSFDTMTNVVDVYINYLRKNWAKAPVVS